MHVRASLPTFVIVADQDKTKRDGYLMHLRMVAYRHGTPLKNGVPWWPHARSGGRVQKQADLLVAESEQGTSKAKG